MRGVEPHATPIISDPSSVFPAQAGTQVRGVEPHVTPIIPHNHDPSRLPHKHPCQTLIYKPEHPF